MGNNITYDGLHDEQFAKPYVDADEWRDIPVRHHYIHGGFEGTQTKFCFYYPPGEAYKRRFYHFMSPFVGSETEAQGQKGEEDKISFAIKHGSYLVETNHGGIINGGDDHTLVYRANACSAQFSRKLAAQFYGDHRPYGYLYGGSGGGFKTISAVENTVNVWDGAVPFVIGSKMAMPYIYTVRSHAMRILRNKLDIVKDAVEPGGSGDPYAGLDEEEAAALREAELLGFPMKTWSVYNTLGEGALPVLSPIVKRIDPTYCRDFWEKPGYLGTDPNGSAVRDHIVMESRVEKIFCAQEGIAGVADTIDENNAYGVDEAWKHAMNRGMKLPLFVLSQFPEEGSYLYGLRIRFLDGKLAGEEFDSICLGGKVITVDGGMDDRDLENMMAQVQEGDRVVLDNSEYIAMQTFHRHQVPEPDYHAWDQFRDVNGNPVYPQRPILVGPVIADEGAGSVQEGNAPCRMIIVASLMDESAFPWMADWYRRLVQSNTGTDAEEKLRLWYMENCMHTDCGAGNGGDHQHIVSYLGALYRALLDLSDWVERDISPASSSCYDMDGGQVRIREGAQARKGIQPVVSMCVNGGERADVRCGETVEVKAVIELPEGCGKLEEPVWDFTASNQFLPGGKITACDGDRRIEAVNSYTYSEPGTYFPVVKVAVNRNRGDEFTQVRNLARVRVVVS